jgi:hypothetical protein
MRSQLFTAMKTHTPSWEIQRDPHAIDIPGEENQRSDSSVTANARAQSHRNMKYSGGTLVNLSPNATIM